jgi:hypothetical protein
VTSLEIEQPYFFECGKLHVKVNIKASDCGYPSPKRHWAGELAEAVAMEIVALADFP